MDSTGAAQLALNDAAAAEVTFSVLSRVSPRDPIAVAQQAIAMARQPSKQQAAITLLTGQVVSACYTLTSYAHELCACSRAMCLLTSYVPAHELCACHMLTSYMSAALLRGSGAICCTGRLVDNCSMRNNQEQHAHSLWRRCRSPQRTRRLCTLLRYAGSRYSPLSASVP